MSRGPIVFSGRRFSRTVHRWMPFIVKSRIPVVPSAHPSQTPSRRIRQVNRGFRLFCQAVRTTSQ